MDMILIRHGETDWNRELRFQGQVDVGLNGIGLEQARRLAARMSGVRAQSLYMSDLLRARQTAQPIARQLNLEGVADAQLREQSFGIVDGMRSDDIQQQYPQHWAGWLRFEEDFSMPEGESTKQFHSRVMEAIHRLAADHSQETVVVVTHGGVLDMIYRTARSLSLSGPRQSEIPNAGYNRVRVEGGKVDIIEWADVTHLGADLPAQPVYDQQKLLIEPNPKAA